jgi:autotransporter-associated beta strand protein
MTARKHRTSHRRALMTTVAAIAGLGAAAVQAGTPINTNQPYYLQSQVGATVLPDFQGGTLRDDQNNVVDTHDYTVENYSTNTIDAYGNKTTFSGIFSGAGPLTITDSVGGGAVVVTSDSIVGGTVTIDSGATLEWGATSTTLGYLYNPGNALVDNGTLLLNYGGGGLGGAIPISGTGALVIQSGSLNEAGVSTFTGAATIDAGGELLLSSGGAIAAASGVTANGILDISGETLGASIRTLSGAGSVNLGGQTLTLTNASGTFSGVLADGGVYGGTGGGLTIAGGTEILTGASTYTGATTINGGAALQLGNGGTTGSVAGGVVDNGILTFDRSDVYVYAGVVSGAGQLVQAGSGTLILNGVNTVSGQTTVSAGVLEIGDSTHPGAVLDSHGGGVTVGAGGTLAGHGSILGAVTNASGGTVAPGGSIGTLTVGSYTQGANSTLAIEVSPTAASQLNSLGAASLNGKLALAFDAGTYVPHVYTIVSGAPLTGTFSSVTVSDASTAGVAYGLDYASNQAQLLVEPAAPAQVYGGVSTATLDRAQGFASLVEDRFGDAGCADGAADRTSEACQGMTAWAQAVGATDNLHGGGASFGFTNSSAGLLGGIDRRWGADVTVGAAFGYEGEDLSMGGASAHASGSAYFGALYGRWTAGRVWLDGQGFYMHSDWTVSRQLTGYGTARSSPGGNTEGFLLQASAPFQGGDLRPYVRISYAQFDRGGVTETGVGALGFAVNSAATSSSIAEAGVLFAHSYEGVYGREVRPALQLGVQDAFGDRSGEAQVGLSGLAGNGVTVSSARIPEVAGVADGSIKVRLSQSFELEADLRGRFGGSQTEGSASLGGVFRF